MFNRTRSLRGRLQRVFTACILAALAAACTSGGSVEPSPPPTITISGVQEGGVYNDSAQITITVDRGSYSATLNGSPFPGGVVREPGSHSLEVTAHAGGASTSRVVGFRIQATGRVLIIRMFDLGNNEAGGGGDAILISDSSSASIRHGLIDAGPRGVNASDPGYVARRLTELGVNTLDFVQLTHAHSDHYAGLTEVLNQFRVRRFVYNGQLRSVSGYNSTLNTARARADSVVTVTEVRSLFGADTVTLLVVPPLRTYLNDVNATSTFINEGSLGTVLRRGEFRMFFTGDGEVEANNRWRTQYSAYTRGVTALKVGHHGANNATFDNGFSGSSQWLAHTSPRFGLVSANGRTHPRRNALSALQGYPVETLCTSVHGDITVRVLETGTYQVVVQRNAGSVCVPGSEATT